jgi:alpha-glucosidase
MHGVLRFWLDRGVDGFRIDVAHCVGKDPTFGDDPRCLAGEPISDFNDQPHSHEVLRGVRRLVDSYPGDRVVVGEVNIRSTEAIATYYGSGDELHMAFNFPPIDAPWDPVVFDSVIAQVETHLGEGPAWPTWVLSNHDNSRHRTRYGGSERRARAAAVLLLTLRGTPFVYQGEELGLEDAVVPPERIVDPGGRDGCRAPVPWEPTPPHGWPGRPTWLPFPPEPQRRNAASLRDDPGSILHLYRDLIRLRRSSPALRWGTWEQLDTPPGVIAYRRRGGDDERLVAVNFTPHPRPVDLPGDDGRDRDDDHGGGWVVELTSDGSPLGAHSRSTAVLATEQAVVLRRAGSATTP